MLYYFMSSRSKTKRKQVDDSEGALNERKKNRSRPPENGVQDVDNTERYNKAKKEKHSNKDRKTPVKEPQIAKKVHKKYKPNLPTHAVTTSSNLSSLAQVERKSTKALALTSTSRPSKEKSKEHKSDNPSRMFSSKANTGKRKSNLEPMKTNSKKSKTNANGKGKDLVTGKKTLNGVVTGNRAAVDSDTSSSQSSTESSSSSSSPESSSESTDESGPSTSHSKVNGTVSRVASAELINNVKSPLHERLGKDVEHKISKDSSLRKTGKDETRVPLKLHTNSKGNGSLRESSSSLESSTDTDKSVDTVRKNTRSSSSSSSSSESEEEKATLGNNNKETSSSLLHPLLSSPSSQSFPSPSLLRGIQMQDTNETSVNQSPIHSITEKISLSGQKQAQQSTIRGENKKPGKTAY